MVASAAWLTIEPEISLKSFLASEELESIPASPWTDEDWVDAPPVQATIPKTDSRA